MYVASAVPVIVVGTSLSIMNATRKMFIPDEWRDSMVDADGQM